MEPTPDKARDWLRQGIERCGPGTPVRRILWTMLCDAVDMVERLDDQERRWLTSAYRSAGWHATVTRLLDRLEMERSRIHSGIKIADGHPYYAPQGATIDRSLWVLTWLRWVHEAPRLGPDWVKAAVLLAKGREQHAAEFLPRSRSRQLSYEIKNKVAGAVIAGLRRDYEIDAAQEVASNEAV